MNIIDSIKNVNYNTPYISLWSNFEYWGKTASKSFNLIEIVYYIDYKQISITLLNFCLIIFFYNRFKTNKQKERK